MVTLDKLKTVILIIKIVCFVIIILCLMCENTMRFIVANGLEIIIIYVFIVFWLLFFTGYELVVEIEL